MNGGRNVSAPIDEYSTGFPTQGDNQATTHQTAEFTPPPDSVHTGQDFLRWAQILISVPLLKVFNPSTKSSNVMLKSSQSDTSPCDPIDIW